MFDKHTSGEARIRRAVSLVWGTPHLRDTTKTGEIAVERNGDVASRASEWVVSRHLDNYKPYPIRIFNPHLT